MQIAPYKSKEQFLPRKQKSVLTGQHMQDTHERKIYLNEGE